MNYEGDISELKRDLLRSTAITDIPAVAVKDTIDVLTSTNAWGGDTEIFLASKHFNKNIVLYSDVLDFKPRIYSADSKDFVYLHLDNRHYSPLFVIPSDVLVSAGGGEQMTIIHYDHEGNTLNSKCVTDRINAVATRLTTENQDANDSSIVVIRDDLNIEVHNGTSNNNDISTVAAYEKGKLASNSIIDQTIENRLLIEHYIKQYDEKVDAMNFSEFKGVNPQENQQVRSDVPVSDKHDEAYTDWVPNGASTTVGENFEDANCISEEHVKDTISIPTIPFGTVDFNRAVKRLVGVKKSKFIKSKAPIKTDTKGVVDKIFAKPKEIKDITSLTGKGERPVYLDTEKPSKKKKKVRPFKILNDKLRKEDKQTDVLLDEERNVDIVLIDNCGVVTISNKYTLTYTMY